MFVGMLEQKQQEPGRKKIPGFKPYAETPGTQKPVCLRKHIFGLDEQLSGQKQYFLYPFRTASPGSEWIRNICVFHRG